MSGICGIVFRDRNYPVSANAVLPMVLSLNTNQRGEHVIDSFGPTAMAARAFPGRLFGLAETKGEGKVSALVFHGNVLNLNDLTLAGDRNPDPLRAMLSLYLKEGITFVRRLRGEFALAIWDAREESLHLATDRFRVHPLLYYYDAEKFVFSSRMKGLLACPYPVNNNVNLQAVVDVVASSFIPTPNTIFNGVKKLPPAHFLSFYRHKVEITPYWEIDFTHSSSEKKDALSQKLRETLTESIAIRLKSDQLNGPIGTFLSGGIDSSTVTGVISRITDRPLKSFSIGFDEQRFNEISYARIAANAFGAEHHEYFVTPRDVCDVIPILLDYFDEPFANASAIPTHYCAKLAREHGVDLLYAGDGGDELFGGNERYATQRLFDYYQKVPSWLRKCILEPVVFTLSDSAQWNFFIKAKKYISRSNIPYPERLSSYGLFNSVPLGDWFEDDFLATVGKHYDPYAAVCSHYFRARARAELDRQLYIDLKMAISDNDLFKVTRMTEAAGVTVRYPFLDHRLAEFAATIPARMKVRGQQLRTFFKNAYANFLPKEILSKPKHGFGLPISVWLRTDKQLNEMLHDLVLSPVGLQRGYFKRKALENLVELHRADGSTFYGTILWNVMILELWHRARRDTHSVIEEISD